VGPRYFFLCFIAVFGKLVDVVTGSIALKISIMFTMYFKYYTIIVRGRFVDTL